MTDDHDPKKKTKSIHINKIEPKTIITEKQDFNPVVRAKQAKGISTEFTPYIKAKSQSQVGQIKQPDFQVKHYQGDREDVKSTKDPEPKPKNPPQKSNEPNYWGSGMWKRK